MSEQIKRCRNVNGQWVEFDPYLETIEHKTNPNWTSVPSGEEIGIEWNGFTGEWKPILAP